MDRMDLYRVFARVVDCASFTRAADSLGLPRSSVSAAVQMLETRLGARLLNRTTRRVSVTEDGAVFYERCVRLLSDMEEAEDLFRNAGGRPSGRLRVDVPGRIGRLVIAPALPEFLAAYPQIEIDLGMTDRAVDLVEERADCVLRVGPLGDSGLVGRRIGDLELINVASPAYLARHGAPAGPQDLAEHLAVNYASPSSGRVEPWELMDGEMVRTQPMRGTVCVNSAEGLIACCLAGLGLIQIPAYDVAGHLAAGELVRVMDEHRAQPMQMTLLYPHRRQAPERLKVFSAWLDTLLRPHVRAP
ncbi:LysR family transcriptional regulator [Phenylobacterium sp. NIBR 498073]|uniref:LysR family transcriptional regulator n=1 Tax=Phenylobacterium sp. NIBR 498073 TaxID=3015177 RepID=UPI0022B4117F|nr:LysR family transcriptional regulator [Phenylobacterium sp. NIBR 498073]WGU38702.1 LysR family transcriptional regulator [Phenylobacterium sp. NIBR 498073]